MKKTVLFNKNHIEIVRKEFNSNDYKNERERFSLKFGPEVVINMKTKGDFELYYFRKESTCIGSRVSARQRPEIKIDFNVMESPLGFYYIEDVPCNLEEDKSASVSEWHFVTGQTETIISYPTRYGETRIGQETRPWMLMDGGMEEHFVNDLLELMKTIKDTIDGETKKRQFPLVRETNWRENGKYVVENGKFGEAWKEAMTDMFGYPDGPKFQTNDEKVLAAGFDLKTSFRK